MRCSIYNEASHPKRKAQLNFQELFIFMVKGKITMYRIIFFIRQLNILIKKKKKNCISIAIFPKKKKKKKKSVALSFFGKSLWDKPFFFFGLSHSHSLPLKYPNLSSAHAGLMKCLLYIWRMLLSHCSFCDWASLTHKLVSCLQSHILVLNIRNTQGRHHARVNH